MISNATQRSVFHWIHLILAIPIAGQVHSPRSSAGGSTLVAQEVVPEI